MIAVDAPIMPVRVPAELVDATWLGREVLIPSEGVTGWLMRVEQSEVYHRTRLVLADQHGIRPPLDVRADDVVIYDALSIGEAS